MSSPAFALLDIVAIDSVKFLPPKADESSLLSVLWVVQLDLVLEWGFFFSARGCYRMRDLREFFRVFWGMLVFLKAMLRLRELFLDELFLEVERSW